MERIVCLQEHALGAETRLLARAGEHRADRQIIPARFSGAVTGQFLEEGPDGIYISGPMVYINSGRSADSAPSVDDGQAIDPDPANNPKPGSPSN
jgi:hypothetical protein